MTLKNVVLIYTLLVLLAAAVTAPLPYLVLCILLIPAVLFTAARRKITRFDVVISVAVIFLAPVALEQGLSGIAGLPAGVKQALAAVLVLPVFSRLDADLKEYARSFPVFTRGKRGRSTTAISAALLAAALVVIVMAPVVGHLVLLLAGVSLLLYLLAMLVWVWRSVPRRPLSADVVAKSIIVGTGGSAPLVLTNRAAVPLFACLRPADGWVRVTPPQTVLPRGRSRLGLDFVPPLAGQARPVLKVTALDPRGLVRIDQVLEPIRLHIIPRAKYAAWLAARYLEQNGSGVVSGEVLPRSVTLPGRGTEYRESRSYRPGDPLRDIDWKHTLKLSQLIIREYQESGEQAAIIAVNLAVTSDENADKLAFDIITAALTLARENIPAALAAYNHREVIASQGIAEPQAVLRRALSLVREITTVTFSGRYLEPVDIARIRRNISQLRQTESGPARRLLDIFSFENRALEESAGRHPATLALMAAARQVPAPAMIFLISQLNHDAEAVLVAGEKLSRRKFTMLPVALA
jgi:uncharacterized protein (DUF58 family)